MTHLIIFLEEQSAKVMLDNLLPRVLCPSITFQCIPFEGKNDLKKQLPLKLRGWIVNDDTHFIVMCDKDRADCTKIKEELAQICCDAGKLNTTIRIACCELESWYLGDLSAVEKAFDIRGLAVQQRKAKYRTPDILQNATQELERLTQGEYSKVGGSREMGKELDIDNNCSHSFNVFMKTIRSFTQH